MMVSTSIDNSNALVKAHVLNNESHREYPTTTNPIGLMVLDLLGFVLIIMGLKQQFGGEEVLHPSLLTSYSGSVLIIIGLIMTLPFIAWTLKTCVKVMSEISV